MMTNLEWLYHESAMFKASMCFWAVYFGHAEDDLEADKWLMSRHVDDELPGDSLGTIAGDREGVNS